MQPIDIHAHFLPADYRELVAGAAPALAPELRADGYLYAGGQRWTRIPPAMHDLPGRLARMDSAGLARQILSAPPALFFYWADGPGGAAVSRRLNEALAAAVASAPGRLLAFANVPLQDPDLAAGELEYAIQQLGHVGAQIGASVEGRDLDDPAFQPFFAAAERLDAPVFVHPLTFVGGERTREHYFPQLLAWPFDTSICIARLIFGGVLDAFPRLRLCFAHAGGTLLFLKGRLDHGVRMGATQTPSGRPPSAYLRQIYVDCLTYDAELLAQVVGTVGADRVLLGTDWPFPIGEPDPVGFVRRNALLPAGAADAILAGNAGAFLGRTVA